MDIIKEIKLPFYLPPKALLILEGRFSHDLIIAMNEEYFFNELKNIAICLVLF